MTDIFIQKKIVNVLPTLIAARDQIKKPARTTQIATRLAEVELVVVHLVKFGLNISACQKKTSSNFVYEGELLRRDEVKAVQLLEFQVCVEQFNVIQAIIKLYFSGSEYVQQGEPRLTRSVKSNVFVWKLQEFKQVVEQSFEKSFKVQGFEIVNFPDRQPSRPEHHHSTFQSTFSSAKHHLKFLFAVFVLQLPLQLLLSWPLS